MAEIENINVQESKMLPFVPFCASFFNIKMERFIRPNNIGSFYYDTVDLLPAVQKNQKSSKIESFCSQVFVPLFFYL